MVRANRGGGEDNITVVFFAIEEDGAAVTEDTVVQPAVVAPEPEREQDPDEDTLDELDRVPAVSTQVFRVEELEAAVAAAPEPAKKPRSRMDRVAGRVLATVLVLAVIAGIVALVVWGLLD